MEGKVRIKAEQAVRDVKPDLKGLAFLSKFAIFHDDNILRSLASELYEEGIEIVSSTIYLPELLAPEAPNGWNICVIAYL